MPIPIPPLFQLPLSVYSSAAVLNSVIDSPYWQTVGDGLTLQEHSTSLNVIHCIDKGKYS